MSDIPATVRGSPLPVDVVVRVPVNEQPGRVRVGVQVENAVEWLPWIFVERLEETLRRRQGRMNPFGYTIPGAIKIHPHQRRSAEHNCPRRYWIFILQTRFKMVSKHCAVRSILGLDSTMSTPMN